MTKKYMSDDQMKRLEKFILKLSNKRIENIEIELKELEDIYHDNENRHLYSRIFSILTLIEEENKSKDMDKKKEIPDLNFVKENTSEIYNFIQNNPDINSKLKYNFIKLYDHVSLDIAKIEYMKNIDRKTEENKRELLRSLENKDKELKEIKQKSEKELKNLQSEVKNIDKDSLIKTTGFISMFTLIAGNISIIFKSLELEPLHLISTVFIINSMIVLAFQLVIYLIDSTRKRKTVLYFSTGCLLMGVLLIFMFPSKIDDRMSKKIEEILSKKKLELSKLTAEEKEAIKNEIQKELYRDLYNQKNTSIK